MTTEPPRPEYDGEIVVCAETYVYRRSHDLLRRVEQRFGALLPLARRAEAFALTQQEAAGVLEELLKGDPQRPSRLDLERWVWEEGSPAVCRPLAKLLYELLVGNRQLRLLEEEKRIAAGEQRDRQAAARPTGPGAAPAPESSPPTQTAALEAALAEALQTMSRSTGSRR